MSIGKMIAAAALAFAGVAGSGAAQATPAPAFTALTSTSASVALVAASAQGYGRDRWEDRRRYERRRPRPSSGRWQATTRSSCIHDLRSVTETSGATAEARLENIPAFVRPMARTGIESFARERGRQEIDEQTLDAAREFFGM